MTKGSGISPITPTNIGGMAHSWSISPALPAGLVFDTSNGSISGTPSVISISTVYTVTASIGGSSVSTTLMIQVNDVPPNSIIYSPSSLSLTKGVLMIPATPTVQGGIVATWAISPSLPTGLSMDPSTGEISGTPSTSSTISSYTVYANNSGGSASTIVTIEVNEAVPVIAYGTTTLTTQINLQINTITPTSTGGPAENWSISPSLPTGLNIDASTGEISGTPTVVSPSTVYTITASNSGGTDTATVTIKVNDVAPSQVTYSSTFLQLTKDTAMTPDEPTNLGGTVTSWTITPSLPNGLSINAVNGTISGTPLTVSTATTYTITAANSGGSATVSITILINDAPPSSINYSPNSSILTKGTTMGTITPSHSGVVNYWTISPALVTGLYFDTSNGEIGGTPTAVSPLTVYTITATNAGGSSSTTITIQVNDIAPNTIIYSPSSLSLINGIGMTPAIPTVQGGYVVSWEISPSLPTGLSMDSSTGEISGTPAASSPVSSYTVYANNTGGSAQAVLTIEILHAPPTGVTYANNPFILARGAPFAVAPTSGGGPAENWSISPSLPTGLSIDSSTGNISGTPTIVSPSTIYTVTASNSGGSATVTINIQVNDIAPYSLTYNPNFFSLNNGSVMTPVTPTNLGGTVTSWSISPSLPNGLFLNAANGTISGTPTAITSLAVYTIIGTNTGGGASTTVTIIVNDAAPSSINYNSSTFNLTKGVTISSVTPTYSGGVANSWSISPGLPLGLTFDSTTGEISGTPTASSPLTTYTITATNAGGSGSTTIAIQIIDPSTIPPHSLSYNDSPFNLTVGTVMPSAIPTISGGPAVNWSIFPPLPQGLSINLSSGEISGTPLQSTGLVSYVVYANNTGGSATAVVVIDIIFIPPVFSYGVSSITAETGSNITMLTPIVTQPQFGPVAVWSVSPSLPNGISLNSVTGVIIGTPTTTAPMTTYVITGVNSGGSYNVTLDLVVNEAPPSNITYTPDLLALTINTVMSNPVSPTANGSPATSWLISPSLPTGLSFGSNNGSIWGTPTVISPPTTYTVTAANNGGSGFTTIIIQVIDVAPPNLVAINNISINALAPYLFIQGDF